jgi:LPXTG-motif cell wall-anchored protein
VTLLVRASPAVADGTGQRVEVEIPPHTVPTTHTGVGPADLLPRTGGAVALWVLAVAVALIVVGAIFVLAGRRGRRGSEA